MVSELVFLPALGENMKTMRDIMTESLKGITSLKCMLQYQEYLAEGDQVCSSLPFRDYYTIKYESWPKDLDENYLKGTRKKLKGDEHAGQEKKHIEEMNPIISCSAVNLKESCINTFPNYLNVQFV